MTCQIISFTDKKRERDERRQPQAGCLWLIALGGCAVFWAGFAVAAVAVTHVLPLLHPFGLKPPD